MRSPRHQSHLVLKPNRVQCLALTLILTTGSAAVLAQTDAAESAEESTAAQPETTTTAEPAGTATQKKPAAQRGNNSPFDYKPSEEISEDLPVSFPVDI